MLLLDRNSAPTRTIYYLSAVCHRLIVEAGNIPSVDLFEKLKSSHAEYKNLGYNFFILALDFLFMLDCVRLDNEGRLCAN